MLGAGNAEFHSILTGVSLRPVSLVSPNLRWEQLENSQLTGESDSSQTDHQAQSHQPLLLRHIALVFGSADHKFFVTTRFCPCRGKAPWTICKWQIWPHPAKLFPINMGSQIQPVGHSLPTPVPKCFLFFCSSRLFGEDLRLWRPIELGSHLASATRLLCHVGASLYPCELGSSFVKRAEGQWEQSCEGTGVKHWTPSSALG